MISQRSCLPAIDYIKDDRLCPCGQVVGGEEIMIHVEVW